MAWQSAKRFKGLQSRLNAIDSDGCYFLTLLSIAEESNESKVDLIDAVNFAWSHELVLNEYTVQNDVLLLEGLTGYKWVRRIVNTLPPTIKENEYTVCKWFNSRTGYKHFRRRGFDTLENSVTVAEGKITEYRIFERREKCTPTT